MKFNRIVYLFYKVYASNILCNPNLSCQLNNSAVQTGKMIEARYDIFGKCAGTETP